MASTDTPTVALRDRLAIAGVGATPQGKLDGRTPLDLGIEAFRNALDDAGLRKGDIDGLLTMPGTTSPEASLQAVDVALAQAGVGQRVAESFDAHSSGVRPSSLPCGVAPSACDQGQAVAQRDSRCIGDWPSHTPENRRPAFAERGPAFGPNGRVAQDVEQRALEVRRPCGSGISAPSMMARRIAPRASGAFATMLRRPVRREQSAPAARDTRPGAALLRWRCVRRPAPSASRGRCRSGAAGVALLPLRGMLPMAASVRPRVAWLAAMRMSAINAS